MFLCAFQWHWDNQTDSSAGSPKPQNTNPPLGQSKQVRPQTAKAPEVQAKPAKEPVAKAQPSKEPAEKTAQASTAMALPQRPIMPNAPMGQNNVVQMQQKINDIIRLNENVNKLNRTRIIQVQAIVDQARIHQRLFAALSSPPDVTGSIKTADADQVLIHEKLRATREETQKHPAAAQGPANGKSPASKSR